MRSLFRLTLTIGFVLFCVSSAAAADSKSHRAAVLELMEMFEMEKMLETQIQTMLNAQAQADPGINEVRQIMLDFYRKCMSWNAIKADVTRIYMEAFTEVELRELIAFYKTPTGRKAIATLPSLTEKSMQFGVKRALEHQTELKQALQEHAKAKSPAKPSAKP